MEQTKLAVDEKEDSKIIANQLAKAQREIGVAEFFAKNRHLLGFDNKRKALLTAIKEGVDNSLDACEEAEILPEIQVEIIEIGEEKFRIIIEDNGPGIVKKQIPKIFAKLLYGSKFHKLSQSLTANQDLIIERNGKVEITTIGKLVDEFVKDDGEININHTGIRVPAFNSKTNTYSFATVSHAIKHKQLNEIYEITLESGRKIEVTGCHSVFSLNKDIHVSQIEARSLKEGDSIIVPKRLPEPALQHTLCLSEYISAVEAEKQAWFVYNIDKETIIQLFKSAEIIHKKTDKSRKYYRLNSLDILDDSYKQYVNKGFLPLHLILKFQLPIHEKYYLQTYFHGIASKVPLVWNITPQLMRFLGLYVAEGHCDKRQIGFTFNKEEKEFVKEVTDFAVMHGINYTVENRDEKNCIRVKVFGGILANLMQKWCNKGAKQKRIPDFVFSSSFENRQHFLDALYQGDGHNTPARNQLMHTTVSKTLANQLLYLWTFQGVVAFQIQKKFKGLGKNPSLAYITTVYGEDIQKSHVFKTHVHTKTSYHSFIPKKYIQEFNPKCALSHTRQIFSSLGLAYTQRQFEKYAHFFELAETTTDKNILSEDMNQHNIQYLESKGFIYSTSNQIQLTQKYQRLQQKILAIQQFLDSDLCLLKIKSIKKLSLKHQWVYDISVPDAENFVAGYGGISAHNTRGQQGIGISAAVMYAQLTTGKPAKITSKIAKDKPAIFMELMLDTKTNNPLIKAEQEKDWPEKDHGTRIEIDIEGSYQKGDQSVDQYLKETAIVNPHTTIIYTNPKAEQIIFPRATEIKPKKAQEIKPHPYGIELGILIDMLHSTESRTLQAFFTTEFSRVGPGTAKEICSNAAVLPNAKPHEISRETAERLIEGIKKTKIIAPPTDCITPIGEELLEKGLKKEVNAEFYCACSRPPAVYRGNPFIVEAALAYGGEQPAEEPMTVLRFANKVPLLFQQGACAITKSLIGTNWRSYGLSQSTGALPLAPITLVVHLASVWVPFTSESKEAIAHYPEIIREVKLAVQECGRKLGSYVGKKRRMGDELKKRGYIEKYIPHIADALKELVEFKDFDKTKVEESLKEILERKRGQLEDIEAENEEYDEEFAKIGKEDEKSEEE